MLEVRGLRKSFGNNTVLHGFDLSVQSGSVVALLGANGAGKTTTLKCVLGVMRFEGSIRIDGVDVRTQGKDARRRVGYVPQAPALNETHTSHQALEFIAALKGADPRRPDEMLALVGLAEQRGMRVGQLSGGMRQRLALAAALLDDPPLLLLDEPTASLDVQSRREFHQLIVQLRDEGKTIILSTHFFEQLDHLADRVLVLKEGRIGFDGSPTQLAGAAGGKRYVVTLNGHSPSQFIGALAAAGITPDRVRAAETRWDEALLSQVIGESAREDEVTS